MKVHYIDDVKDKTKVFPLDSNELAPYESHKSDYEWRFNLQTDDKVDYEYRIERYATAWVESV